MTSVPFEWPTSPGNSDGHLALYDAANRAVFVGDALARQILSDHDRAPIATARLLFSACYLGTLQFLEAFAVEWIYSGHWPAYHGAAVAEFLAECRRFMDMPPPWFGKHGRRDVARLHRGLRTSIEKLAGNQSMVA